MKVCFFSHGSGTNQDGATLSMLNVMAELANRDHEVIGIMAKDVNLEYMKKKKNVKFYFIPSYDMRLDLSRTGQKVELKYFVKNKLNWFIMQKTLKILRNENIDIIHINGLNNGIGAMIAQKLRIPYVWHIRQLMEEDLHQRLYNQKKVWPMVKSANAVIAISRAVKEKFEKEFNREIIVVYNGVPVEKYRIDNHSIFDEELVKMVLPGRIVEGKGQLEAVKALKYLIDNDIKNVKLILVGHKQSKYAQEVEAFVAKNDIASYIEIQEHNADLRSLRGICDIGLTCSVKEAFGRVTVENQMAGLLAIGSNTGGTPELIEHKVTGLLYQQGSYQSLASQIEYAIHNRELMKKIARNSYQYSVENYSIKRVVDQVEKIYSNIIHKDMKKW